MGTRSLTVFKDEDGKEFLTLYRQYDGYLEGHGKKLCRFLDGFKVINGFGDTSPEIKQANGMGCLAAQVIAHLKKGSRATKHAPARGPIGNIYLMPPGIRDQGEEYIYTVHMDGNTLKVDVEGSEEGSRTPAEWLRFIRKQARAKSKA